MNAPMVAAPITGRQYYQALLLVVDAVERDGVEAARAALRADLAALEHLQLADTVWMPEAAEPPRGIV